MITLSLSTIIHDVTVEVQGEANDLDEIKEAWEAFVLSTYQVEYGNNASMNRQNISAIQEVL